MPLMRCHHSCASFAIVLLPKRRLNPQFIDALDEHAEIMTQDFTQHLIDLSYWQFRPHDLAKLSPVFVTFGETEQSRACRGIIRDDVP